MRGYELTLRRSDAQKIEIEECAGLCSGYGSCPYSAARRPYAAIARGGKREENDFALAGNQNSGKTTLFNSLTGSNQRVGNSPA